MQHETPESIVLGRLGLGNRIRSLREGSHQSLADTSQGAAISLSYLSDVERGRRLPTLEVLHNIAYALNTTTTGVLSGLYPWDTDEAPTGLEPPPDARRRKPSS